MATTNPDWLQPLAQWTEVEVTFPSVANTDCIIPHDMVVVNPEAVNYVPVRKDRAADVYHDTSATRRKWQNGYIVLRCSVANARVRFLLFLDHTASTDAPSF